jgi:hypothetical protein
MSLTDGLVGYWPMNERSGNAVIDQSGYGNNGSLVSGMTWGDPRVGAASLNFNGTSEYATVAANTAIGNLTSDFTIASWFYGDNLTTGDEAIWDVAESPSDAVGFALIVRTDGGVQFTTKGVFDYLWSAALTGITPLNPTGWWHIAATLDATFDADLYINGSQISTLFHTVAANANTTQATFIGAAANAGATASRWWMKGRLDDLRIYNRKLSTTEIHQLFLFGRQTFVNTLRPKTFAPGLAR